MNSLLQNRKQWEETITITVKQVNRCGKVKRENKNHTQCEVSGDIYDVQFNKRPPKIVQWDPDRIDLERLAWDPERLEPLKKNNTKNVYCRNVFRELYSLALLNSEIAVTPWFLRFKNPKATYRILLDLPRSLALLNSEIAVTPCHDITAWLIFSPIVKWAVLTF